MSEPDLTPQLDRIESLLDRVETQIGAFDSRLEDTGRSIAALAALVPNLDLVLAMVNSAKSPNPAEYEALAESIFQPLQTRLATFDQALDISFSPVTALDGLAETIIEELGDIDAFATSSADKYAEDVSELSELITEGITERLREAVGNWQAESEAAETSVTEAAEKFSAFRDNAADAMEEWLKERLVELLGNELGEVTGKIDSVFSQSEEALDRIEELISGKVDEVVGAAEKVLVVQRAIRNLRPLMEILR